MAIGSKNLSIDALDGFDNERLTEELKKAKAELFNLRFQSATGQLENHGRLKAVRREIARIYTVLNERELDSRPKPTNAKEEGKRSRSPRPPRPLLPSATLASPHVVTLCPTRWTRPSPSRSRSA